MGEIHNLIRTHGRDAARRLIEPDDTPYFQIASNLISEESNETGITYSGFCLTSLPHRRLPDDRPWVRSNADMSLLIEPGRRPKVKNPRSADDYVQLGVPYGAKARLILLYLQTMALRNNSPEVELGRSMNDWLDRMGISTGGSTYKEVRNQAERLSRCKLTFDYGGSIRGKQAKGHTNDTIVRHAIDLRRDDGQGMLWDERGGFILSPSPPPVRERLIAKSA